MKVYQSKGKRPFFEIEHIRGLLGALWRGASAYDPGHEHEDATIILDILNEVENKQSEQMLRDKVSPTLLHERWLAIQSILLQDGYEVKTW